MVIEKVISYLQGKEIQMISLQLVNEIFLLLEERENDLLHSLEEMVSSSSLMMGIWILILNENVYQKEIWKTLFFLESVNGILI